MLSTPPPRTVRVLSVGVVLAFVVSGRAFAIPSPDLVVNLFASAAQVLGLVSVIVGSWFFGRRKSASKGGGSAKGWKVAFSASTVLFVASALGWMFFALHVEDRESRRMQTNLERSSKEDGKTVGDVSLKELSFSEQLKRNDGIETTKVDELRAQKRFARIYDVREAEEYEVGRIAGAPHVRYPDLMKAPSKYLKREEPALLLCFNGNRSSEMCHELREQGYDVYFVIGGYEKWIAEDRPLEMAKDHERTELRELPDYPNKDVLLSTEDVFDLMAERDVLFVDVRYPGEFEGLGHLPGAINLPARKLTTPELEAAMQALPRKPVIIPCYDRRSSFFASIVGLRLSRMGFEFLGRYPTPEGFWIPGKDKPHVAAWKQAQEERTLLSGIEAPVTRALSSTATRVGGLALAIALLVLALRLVVLPLTLKADRDRLVQAQLAPRLAEITARCGDDAAAASRATMKLLREHSVRPFVNVLASVLQILLFTIAFGAVGSAAKGSLEPFAWVPMLGEPDPYYALPAIVAVLLAAMIVVGAARVTRTRLAVAVLCGLALGALVTGISAASNLYLTLNLALLVGQALLVRAWFDARERRAAAPAPLATHAAVVALRDADRCEGAGNKAVRLAQLLRAGLPVPDGFVVTCRAIDEWREQGRWSESARAEIVRAFEKLGAQRVAVRSSGLKEDGAAKSYAGVFESVLDVERERLFDALAEVAGSLDSGRARAYAEGAERGAVVVQAMVPADFAGVLFTEHPACAGACAVELVPGLGEALVSGRADPISVRLGRLTGRPLGDTRAPIDLEPLFRLGREVETLFGRPQDVEWAHANGRFHLLQARDVTRRAIDGTSATALRERERARLLALAAGAGADEVVFAQNELSELLPRPTPYSLSWMGALWDHGGSTDLTCREFGLPYDVLPDSPPFVVGVFGTTFVDPREALRRLPSGPGALASFRLSRAADQIERAWREDHLPKYLREARLREALDLTQLAFKELVELHAETTRRILTETYLEAERVNVAADFYFKSAVRALEKHGLDPARHLAHLPETVVHQAMSRLAAAGRGETDLSAFQKLFGHRAPQDFELSQPRYAESPKVVRGMMARAAAPARRHQDAELEPITKKVLALSVERARRFQALKEEAKHHALRDFAFLRALLLEIGERLEAGHDVFLLTHTEIARLADPAFRADVVPGLLRERALERAAFESVSLSGSLTVHQLETLELEGANASNALRSGEALRGLRVSGSGDVVGRARNLTSSDEIEHFRTGEILIARFTDPTWTPVFPRARGIVTEVGGWLSHAAILARECDITAIVGVRGALANIATGDLVSLGADGTVTKLAERRAEERVRIEVTVALQREKEELPARLGDVSDHGALVLVPGHSLEIGEQFVLHCVEVDRRVEATVVRNGTPGVYGVRFRHESNDVVVELARRGAIARS